MSTEDTVKWRDLWWVLVVIAIFIFICVSILIGTMYILYDRYKNYMDTQKTCELCYLHLIFVCHLWVCLGFFSLEISSLYFVVKSTHFPPNKSNQQQQTYQTSKWKSQNAQCLSVCMSVCWWEMKDCCVSTAELYHFGLFLILLMPEDFWNVAFHPPIVHHNLELTEKEKTKKNMSCCWMCIWLWFTFLFGLYVHSGMVCMCI